VRPAIITSRETVPAEARQAIAVRFGADHGHYLFCADEQSAKAALEWVFAAAERSPMSEIPVVGIDIETTALAPAAGRIRLAQIAAGDRCVVLDCFAFDVWSLLRRATAKKSIGWIAHNAEFEQSWIGRHAGFTLSPMFDTRWVFVRERARQTGVFEPKGSNLKYVCRELLDFELNKDERLSDWSTPELSAAQLQYAALDALVLIPLRRRLERSALDYGWTAEVDAAAERSAAEALRFA
jgi:ribonuclease D